MSITIIIPTLKLDNNLEKLLEQLPSDVIIVNGGTDTPSSVSYTHLTLPTNREV